MECQSGQLNIVLKTVNDLILQELKSMRQDMKMEFEKIQENLENVVSKLLPETNKTETMNHTMPFGKTVQPSVVQSDTGICIQEIPSDKASALVYLKAIEENTLSLQDHDIFQAETDGKITSMSNNIDLSSGNEANATFGDKIVDSEKLTQRNSHVEYNISPKDLPVKIITNGECSTRKVKCALKIVKNDIRKHFYCAVCNKSFSRKSTLQNHLRNHAGIRPFQCNVCRKSFSCSSVLKQHLSIHTEECPYQCHVCCKPFSRKDHLQTHMRSHTGERPYQCKVCCKSFLQSSHLQTHMKIHIGDRPYQCDVCCKSFPLSSTLKAHKKTHNGERPYQCDVCCKSFSRSSNLHTHMTVHTGQRSYQCKVCFKSFSYNSGLHNHMKIHNRDQPR
ncbi:uncharacterized protein LOC143468287 [Clavelina lepadiformis]|uniref:uncharacterized protein LOC143468287 n=1 Tax=Clavelina lepadiformis TaxID=159417 RepID=UPI004040EBE7